METAPAPTESLPTRKLADDVGGLTNFGLPTGDKSGHFGRLTR